MGCVFSTNHPHVDINFGKPFGSHESDGSQVYQQVDGAIQGSDDVFKLIEEYKGCQELARAAMSNPSPETQKAAFEGLLGAVSSIAQFYAFSQALEKVFPSLLTALAEKIPDGSTVAPLDDSPALTGQLALIFDFALSFDRVRMLRPNLSNDFSYYRRLLPKFNKHPDITVKDDEASAMALFTAQHIPMTSTLAKAGNTAKNEAGELAISYILATMANSALMVLVNGDADDKLKIARVMTGAAVIFDHVDDRGAFQKSSLVSIKAIIAALKQVSENHSEEGSSLLNALRYSTRTFRDAPESIQQSFD